MKLANQILEQTDKDKLLIKNLLGATMGFRMAQKKEIKPGIWLVENPSGKFRLKAEIDLKKKVVKFKGQTDDKLSAQKSAEDQGFKFTSL